MKLNKFATATTTLFGAALVAYGQTQTDQRPDSVLGASNTEQTSGAAGTSATADPQQTGTTAGQQQTGQAGQPQAGQAGQQTQPEIEGTVAERAQRAQAMRDLDWGNAEEAQMQLNEIPERAHNTLTTVTTGAQLEPQITRLNKDDHEVFRATVNRANEQDLHIYVAQDGTVVKTMQQVGFADAPESVRITIREQVGEEPAQLHRVIADDETSFVAKRGEAEDAPKVRVDNTGNLIEQGRQTPAENRQQSTPQDQQSQPQGEQQGQQQGGATGPADN